MPRRGKRIACLLVAATLALPGAAFGQSAGDEQYDDPFAPEEQSGGSQPEPAEPEPEPAPAAPTTPSAEPAQAPAPSPGGAEEGGSGQLPYTGAESGLLALAGGTLVISGLALRRRTRPSAGRA